MALQKNRHGVTISDLHWQGILKLCALHNDDGIGKTSPSAQLKEILDTYFLEHPIPALSEPLRKPPGKTHLRNAARKVPHHQRAHSLS